MIVLIDNYDSFTYNLVQYMKQLNHTVLVKRNDAIQIEEIERLSPECIILSPGPGHPDQAGICLDLIEHFQKELPILGICLGHQAVARAFGGTIIPATQPMHGKVSAINHDGSGIFHSLPSPLNVTRYHSLIVERETLPDCLEITAETSDGEIMGLRHKRFPIEGIQAHPEAILTKEGLQMLNNFITNKGGKRSDAPVIL
ncbi:anthranilate synthase component II [Oceanobacillus manasiensis]|uniref:anthranilate synthase component II n=1 Tax=Oceanobacillus manasiensis TaxID=586413 RepID=UPI0005AA0272|nr:aminodeoxychorismate/anthranilate synthase component II [Oceanobacillus manasiensis]